MIKSSMTTGGMRLAGMPGHKHVHGAALPASHFTPSPSRMSVDLLGHLCDRLTPCKFTGSKLTHQRLQQPGPIYFQGFICR